MSSAAGIQDPPAPNNSACSACVWPPGEFLSFKFPNSDRVRRARLLASRHNLAILIAVGSPYPPRSSPTDALHAVAALLHHAAATHRHIRIPHQLQLSVVKVGIQQEVKPPHLVRAVVRAVSCPDAAVINHRVQAFRRVHRCSHRANLLAGRVLAVLAEPSAASAPAELPGRPQNMCPCESTA